MNMSSSRCNIPIPIMAVNQLDMDRHKNRKAIKFLFNSSSFKTSFACHLVRNRRTGNATNNIKPAAVNITYSPFIPLPPTQRNVIVDVI